jgi:hypothetical protein
MVDVRFAPLNIPLKRRRETMAVFGWVSGIPICLCIFFLCCAFPVFWPFIIAYLLFVLFDEAPENGGRRIEWMRQLRVWKWFVDYFPVKLIKVSCGPIFISGGSESTIWNIKRWFAPRSTILGARLGP